LVMSSPIDRRGIQSSDTSSDLFCEVRMNSPKFKENFGIPPGNRKEQMILLNFWMRTNKRLL
jgi:hypothetical protein